MDKVAEFYARWFAKKRAPDYSDAEAASEELANNLLGVHESNKRDFWQSCAVKFLRGTILHLSSQAHFAGRRANDLLGSNCVPRSATDRKELERTDGVPSG
jgi:hypothetical protein